jgi:hypothetical protein
MSQHVPGKDVPGLPSSRAHFLSRDPNNVRDHMHEVVDVDCRSRVGFDRLFELERLERFLI